MYTQNFAKKNRRTSYIAYPILYYQLKFRQSFNLYTYIMPQSPISLLFTVELQDDVFPETMFYYPSITTVPLVL